MGTVAGPSRGTSGSSAARTSSIGWPPTATTVDADQVLVRRSRGGDHHALGQLVDLDRQHRPGVVGLHERELVPVALAGEQAGDPHHADRRLGRRHRRHRLGQLVQRGDEVGPVDGVERLWVHASEPREPRSRSRPRVAVGVAIGRARRGADGRPDRRPRRRSGVRYRARPPMPASDGCRARASSTHCLGPRAAASPRPAN